MNNIVLIGMPACGKSITGVVLAKTMRMNFVDTDLLIQEKEGRTLQEIIDHSGIEYFKNAEETVLSGLKVENTIISTGGSAIYYPESVRRLKENGRLVYLEICLPTVLKRLKNIKTRGVAMEKGDTIENLYRERVPLYEKYADFIVQTDNLTPEETVEKIVKLA